MVEQSLEPEMPDRLALRRFVLICISISLLCLALKPMSWFAPRAEVDEQVYWTLARHFQRTGEYTLQGTGAIEALNLSPQIYGRPFFHHPPLYTFLLLPFAAARNPNAAIVISWLGHVLAIIGISLVCWTWRRPGTRGTEFTLWLPVLAVAVDPLMMFCSRKLWLDSLVGGFDALAIGLTALAIERRRMTWMIGAGIAFGLAGLTKLTGLVPIASAAVWVLFAWGSHQGRTRMAATLVAPVIVLVLPWLVLFRMKTGVWLPGWVAPNPESIAAFSHVARSIERGWHYYVIQSALIAPVSIACAIRAFTLRGEPARRAALGWGNLAVAGVAMIVLGVGGMGMQMRYVTPCVSGLYALLAAQLSATDERRSFFPAIVLICVAYGCIQTGFYLQAVEFDEIVSLPEMAWRAIRATAANRGVGG